MLHIKSWFMLYVSNCFLLNFTLKGVFAPKYPPFCDQKQIYYMSCNGHAGLHNFCNKNRNHFLKNEPPYCTTILTWNPLTQTWSVASPTLNCNISLHLKSDMVLSHFSHLVKGQRYKYSNIRQQ